MENMKYEDRARAKFEKDLIKAQIQDDIAMRFTMDSIVTDTGIHLRPNLFSAATNIIDELTPEPLYVLNNKLSTGYGHSETRAVGYTVRTPLEPKFPYMLNLDEYRAKLSWYTKLNNKIYSVGMEIPTHFTIQYETAISIHDICNPKLKECSLVYPKDIGLDKFNFIEQTWGSCDPHPYSYALWINQEPQASDQSTAKEILELIWKHDDN
jgi:hypothetical protein